MPETRAHKVADIGQSQRGFYKPSPQKQPSGIYGHQQERQPGSDSMWKYVDNFIDSTRSKKPKPRRAAANHSRSHTRGASSVNQGRPRHGRTDSYLCHKKNAASRSEAEAQGEQTFHGAPPGVQKIFKPCYKAEEWIQKKYGLEDSQWLKDHREKKMFERNYKLTMKEAVAAAAAERAQGQAQMQRLLQSHPIQRGTETPRPVRKDSLIKPGPQQQVHVEQPVTQQHSVHVVKQGLSEPQMSDKRHVLQADRRMKMARTTRFGDLMGAGYPKGNDAPPVPPKDVCRLPPPDGDDIYRLPPQDADEQAAHGEVAWEELAQEHGLSGKDVASAWLNESVACALQARPCDMCGAPFGPDFGKTVIGIQLCALCFNARTPIEVGPSPNLADHPAFRQSTIRRDSPLAMLERKHGSDEHLSEGEDSPLCAPRLPSIRPVSPIEPPKRVTSSVYPADEEPMPSIPVMPLPPIPAAFKDGWQKNVKGSVSQAPQERSVDSILMVEEEEEEKHDCTVRKSWKRRAERDTYYGLLGQYMRKNDWDV